ERAWSFIEEQARNNRRGVRVRLTKRIPIGAGLGGGSSDAAGFLIGVNRLLGLGFVDERLREMASALGADVPFFLRGGTARATGRGDEVRHLCPLPGVWIVLATPPIAVSTTWAYGRVRIRLTPPGRGASMLAAAIERHDWSSIASGLHNDFEGVVLPELEIVARLRRLLGESDLLGSLLSGSGSTVFGLALTQADAQRAAERAAAAGATVHVVRTTERRVRHSRTQDHRRDERHVRGDAQSEASGWDLPGRRASHQQRDSEIHRGSDPR